MCHANICNNTHIGTRDFCKAGHLPESADSHLKDGNLVVLADIEYGERKPDLIVKIPFCFEDIVFLT